MKFVFHVSPNMRGKQTTQGIMRDLTIGLLAVFLISMVYYGTAYGIDYALRELGLLAASLATTFVCESIFALITKKEVLPFLKTSFGWVTAIILTMMCTINITYYALIIATIFAIVFARLLFGGFGNNIFNPAAVGRAVIFAAFTGATADLVTSATPTTVIGSSYHWLPATAEALDGFLAEAGGWTSLLLGTYPGAMGETFSLAILLVMVFLIWRKVIDWRIPVVYLTSIAVIAAIIAVLTGLESYNGIPALLWYPAIHLLTGGVIFGAVFMLTDPVTNPTVAAGRVIFALGAAVLTMLIRMNGNLPEGCLYSILLMNMLTPMIEQSLDGKQLEMKKKAMIIAGCTALLGVAAAFYAASSVEPVTSVASGATSSATTESTSHATEEVSTGSTEEVVTEATEETSAGEVKSEATEEITASSTEEVVSEATIVHEDTTGEATE